MYNTGKYAKTKMTNRSGFNYLITYDRKNTICINL